MSKKFDKPQKVRTSLDELAVLSDWKGTVGWAIFKRLAARYITNLKAISFNMVESDPHVLSVNHAGLRGEARAIRKLIRMVENSGEEYEKQERKEEELRANS